MATRCRASSWWWPERNKETRHVQSASTRSPGAGQAAVPREAGGRQKAQRHGDGGLARRPVVRGVGPLGENGAITDMPEPMGGKAAGSNPGWLLRAGMASCAATAIAMRAAMQGIALTTLEVKVRKRIRTRAASSAFPMFRPHSAICACRSGSAPTASTRRGCASWRPGAKPTRRSAARCGRIRPWPSTCRSSDPLPDQYLIDVKSVTTVASEMALPPPPLGSTTLPPGLKMR